MPKFDVNEWKRIHPASTAGSGIVAALKDWQIMCPEKYDDPGSRIDPQKVASGVTTALKRLTAAIAAAEGLLAKDKNAAEKDKVAKTKVLLARWEAEATRYFQAVSKWAREAVKEQGDEKKYLQVARVEFETSLVESLAPSLLKMAALAKECEAYLKAGKLPEAIARFKAHRELLNPAQFRFFPAAMAKKRQKIVDQYKKYNVGQSDLPVPKTFVELSKKVEERAGWEEKMARRLERALAGEEDEEDDEDAENPAHEKALMDVAIFCKKHVNKIRAEVPNAQKWAGVAEQVGAIKFTTVPAVEKGISDCNRVSNEMIRVMANVESSRRLLWGSNCSLNSMKKSLGLKDDEFSKTVTPLVTIGADSIKKIVKARDKVSAAIEKWMGELPEAHPLKSTRDVMLKAIQEKMKKHPLTTS